MKSKLEGQQISGGICAPAISENRITIYFWNTTNVGDVNVFIQTQDTFGSWSESILLPDVHRIDPSLLFNDKNKSYKFFNLSSKYVKCLLKRNLIRADVYVN